MRSRRDANEVAATVLHALSLMAVALSIGLWLRAKGVDDSERANAERRALFVGPWPVLLWLIGDTRRAAARGSRR